MSTPRISSGVSGRAWAPQTPRQDPQQAQNIQQRVALHTRWEAYEGHFEGPLGQLEGRPDVNVISNRVGSVVRGGVDFLFGPTLKMEHPTSDAQDILDAVWGNDDQRMALLARCRINGGVYGHVVVKLVTPKNGKPPSIDNPPRLVVQNPEQYDFDTEPDDVDEVTCYRCVWSSTDEEGNPCQMMQTTQRVDPDDPTGGMDNNAPNQLDPDVHWEIQNWQKQDNGAEFFKVGPVMMWPYKFAPIVDWQNYPRPNEHWGAPDVDESVVNLNRNLHLVESNINATLYSHGHPWLFNEGTGDTSGITPTPGAITDVPGGNIKSISASGDPNGMMNFAGVIRANMDEATAMPGVATGRMTELPRGQVSGITMHLLYGPRIMRTEQERRLYGQGVRDLCRLILTVCGQDTAAEEDVQLTWQDALPTDDLAMAQMAMTLQQLGVSKHSIFALIGLDYETELEYQKQEAQDAAQQQAAGLANPQGAQMPNLAQGTDPSGQGSPPAAPGAGGAPAQGVGNGGTTPPVNHPAAIAARQAMQQAAKKMKLNG